MTVQELFKSRNLDRSVLIGYYGGGNYGDELLLEVLANLFKKYGLQHITITHQQPAAYQRFHHDFGYQLINMGSKPQLLKAILANRTIIIGGGGLWGLDVNPNIFLLSLLLFISRWVLGKNVYLLGVGYYNSTGRLGRVSAWLAGKAATYIVARDTETATNFGKLTKQVGQDTDLAWYARDFDLQPYQADVAELEKTLPITQKTLFVTLRRFNASQKNGYAAVVQDFLRALPKDTPVILSLLEPKEVDPAGYELAQSLAAKHSHIRVADFSYNPLALFVFFKKHHKNLALIGPQFHIIITAHLAGVPFVPVVYDNKVAELLDYIGSLKPIPIKDLQVADLQAFSDTFFKRKV